MLPVKTLFLAILGFSTMTLAAPADTGVANPAVTKAIQDATNVQAVKDICSGIPFEERRRHRECEDRQDGDKFGECLEVHRSGGRDPRCGDSGW